MNIYTNQKRNKYFYFNTDAKSVVTLEFIDSGARIATKTGEKARMLMLELKHKLKYDAQNNDLVVCSTYEFADAFDKAQRLAINSIKNLNIQTV